MRFLRFILLSGLLFSCARADVREPASGKPGPGTSAKPKPAAVLSTTSRGAAMMLGIPTNQAYTMAHLMIAGKNYSVLPDTGSSPLLVSTSYCKNCRCSPDEEIKECYAPRSENIVRCGTPGMCSPEVCRSRSPFCSFSETFVDGGALVAGVYSDEVALWNMYTGRATPVLKRATFGGILSNLSNFAGHGVLGLERNPPGFSPSGPTLLEQMARAGKLARTVGFCLWDGWGRLEMGLRSPSLSRSAQIIPLKDANNRNALNILAFGFRDPAEAHKNVLREFGVRTAFLGSFALDSGSSVTTLRKPVFDAMKYGLQRHYTRDGVCTLNLFCGGRNVFNNPDGPTSWYIPETLMARLPTLTFRVHDGNRKVAVLLFSPRQYMIRQMTGAASYEFGIRRGGINILGLNFMRRRYTYFDYEKSRVIFDGVSPSKMCTNRGWQEFPRLLYPGMGAAAFEYGGDYFVVGGISMRKQGTRIIRETPPNVRYRRPHYQGAPFMPEPMPTKGLDLVTGFRACALWKDSIFCTGGLNVDTNRITTEAVTYNLKSPSSGWKKIAPLYRARLYHRTIACGNAVYAVGGYNRKGNVNTLERYIPGTDRWVTLKATLPVPAADSGAACFKGRIYIAGGLMSRSEGKTNAVFVLKPGAVARWGNQLQLPYPMSGVTLFTAKGSLFVHDGERGIWRMIVPDSPVEKPYFWPEPSLPSYRYRPGILYDPALGSLRVFGGGDKSNGSMDSAKTRRLKL